jgi:hypothetical protein
MALAEEAREHILERLVTGNKARATEYTLEPQLQPNSTLALVNALVKLERLIQGWQTKDGGT